MMNGTSGERPGDDVAGPIWRTVYTALVLDAHRANEARVLVVPASAGRDVEKGAAWVLPQWVIEEKRDHEQAAHLTAEARDRLGLDAVVLRYLEPREDESRHVVNVTVVLELHAVGGAP